MPKGKNTKNSAFIYPKAYILLVLGSLMGLYINVCELLVVIFQIHFTSYMSVRNHGTHCLVNFRASTCIVWPVFWYVSIYFKNFAIYLFIFNDLLQHSHIVKYEYTVKNLHSLQRIQLEYG